MTLGSGWNIPVDLIIGPHVGKGGKTKLPKVSLIKYLVKKSIFVFLLILQASHT